MKLLRCIKLALEVQPSNTMFTRCDRRDDRLV